MQAPDDLFANNRAWAAAVTRDDPDFFQRLSRQQSPQFLWIGCSDSRVPANQIVGLLPGEMLSDISTVLSKKPTSDYDPRISAELSALQAAVQQCDRIIFRTASQSARSVLLSPA
jgi:carbonic anhydrase